MRILLVIGGGIAAYKALEIIRLARGAGHSVRCILTAGGAEFVTPLSLATLSGSRVFSALFDLTDEAEIGHIRLAREADAIVVAPATADLMAKLAAGLAGDLATTVLLAADVPILVAPAMNWRMWQHPTTQRNAAQLAADGVHFVGPEAGEMACNEYGVGRMAEPVAILAAAESLTQRSARAPEARLSSTAAYGLRGLAGRHVLVTAGPTHEPIDPVRYIANRSSGRQGYAIAAAAAAAGARVTLISGPTALPAPAGVARIEVESAAQMHKAALSAMPADIAVMAAAVADWTPAAAPAKLKKNAAGAPALALAQTADILAAVAKHTLRPALVIGFAAETEALEAGAQAKRLAKGADWIVANDVSAGSGTFGGGDNAVLLVTASGTESWPRMPKEDVARRLIERAAEALGPCAQAAE